MYCAILTLIGCAMPFFGSFLALCGAIGFTSLDFIMPILLFDKVRACVCVCGWVGGGVGGVGGCRGGRPCQRTARSDAAPPASTRQPCQWHLTPPAIPLHPPPRLSPQVNSHLLGAPRRLLHWFLVILYTLVGIVATIGAVRFIVLDCVNYSMFADLPLVAP